MNSWRGRASLHAVYSPVVEPDYFAVLVGGRRQSTPRPDRSWISRRTRLTIVQMETEHRQAEKIELERQPMSVASHSVGRTGNPVNACMAA